MRAATARLILNTTPAVAAHLDRLVETGFFGATPEEAAEQLLRERLRDVLPEIGESVGQRFAVASGATEEP